ncbi:MAG: glycosyltransferase family 9 protein [Bacteroidia bacterium]|nr:glycosyltransferase family 9 protein [Bacteroidia bacterium]
MSAMGDVAMTIPVLRVLLATYPHLQITVLTRALFIPLFEEFEQVHMIIPDLKKKHKGILGLYRLSKELSTLSIDYVADLHDVLRSKILRYFLAWKSIPIAVIDKGRAQKKQLTQNKKKQLIPLRSTHQRYADVFESSGYPVNLQEHRYPPKQDVHPSTMDLIQLLLADHPLYENWIGIAPFAKHSGKSYPIDLMEEVIEDLAGEKVLIFLFGGGPEESLILQSIDNFYPNVISIAGKLNLSDEINLISGLQVMISMDSANMHLASNVNTRVISLWGATHPCLGFYGFDQHPEDALLPNPELYPNLPSSVYGNKIFPKYEECMRSINPLTITAKVKALLNNLPIQTVAIK